MKEASDDFVRNEKGDLLGAWSRGSRRGERAKASETSCDLGWGAKAPG